MKYAFLILFVLSALLVLAQSVNSFIKYGNQFYKQAQFDLAENQYRQALAEEPSSIEARYNLASALHQQKKYDEARAMFQQITSMSKDSSILSMVSYNVGVSHTKQKKLEESIEAYKQALRMNPEDQQARENLQKALKEQKKQQNQSQSQSQNSSMDQSEADQKLQLLQQKERQIRQRSQNKTPTGGGGSKDW
ncbi:MAG: tetratricopeptide repeat protein [Flavisolibacter sp.]|nr:tetratricopeptide repeat protein [Flavisolibacter sp.]